MLNQIKTIAINDFKLIFRDVTLKLFFILPLVLIVLVVWFVPMLLSRFEFLNDYIPLILMLFIIENTQAFCIIHSLLFIEEKETQTAKVYGVLPISKKGLILARLFIPYVLTVLFNVILLSFQKLIVLGFIFNVVFALLAALTVPIYVLLLCSYAKNRLEGMVYIKLFNLLVLLPLVAFFIGGNWVHILGILPTHWLYQSINTGLNVGFDHSLWFAFIYLFYSLIILKFSINHFISNQFE